MKWNLLFFSFYIQLSSHRSVCTKLVSQLKVHFVCRTCTSTALADIPKKKKSIHWNWLYSHTLRWRRDVWHEQTVSNTMEQHRCTGEKATVEKFSCKVSRFTSGRLLQTWALKNTKFRELMMFTALRREEFWMNLLFLAQPFLQHWSINIHCCCLVNLSIKPFSITSSCCSQRSYTMWSWMNWTHLWI